MIDLIDEACEDLTSFGYETTDLNRYGMTCSKLSIDTVSKAKKLGFDKGDYFILNAPLLSGLLEKHKEILFVEVRKRLKMLFDKNRIKKKDKILFVGIGNPEIMADRFGVDTVSKILIQPFKKNNRVFKLLPNTFSNTGFNAYELIHLVVQAFDISAVVLVDSLATNCLGRLGCSIQFNDAGLTPGSAMNSFGMAINKSTLSVPCFAVGVPMMISSGVIQEKTDIILTEKDVKEKVEFLSSLVAEVFDSLM